MTPIEVANHLSLGLRHNGTDIVQLVGIERETWEELTKPDPHYRIGITTPQDIAGHLFVSYCPRLIAKQIASLPTESQKDYLNALVYHLCYHVIGHVDEDFIDLALLQVAPDSATLYNY